MRRRRKFSDLATQSPVPDPPWKRPVAAVILLVEVVQADSGVHIFTQAPMVPMWR